MIARFKKVINKHQFVNQLERCNNILNVKIKKVEVMDEDVQITFSVRNDDMNYIVFPPDYKYLQEQKLIQIIDWNKIS